MTQTLRIQDVDVHVEGAGADTVVMVHGWPDTHRLWDGQVAFLKDRYRCVRFTLPGFAAGDVRRSYALDELTGFIKQVVDQVSPQRKVILLLHDWGCVIGYAYYARYADTVAKIVGVDIGDARSLRRVLSLRDQALIFGYQFWLALAWKIGGGLGDRMTRYMARRARYPLDLAEVGSRMTYPYYELWLADRARWRDRIPEFRPACPMLFIYARRKPFMLHAQPWIDELQARPGNRVEGFDTGHWVMIQEPRRFNQVVGDWLAAA